MQLHLMGVRPGVQRPTLTLRAVVDSLRLRIAAYLRDRVQDATTRSPGKFTSTSIVGDSRVRVS